MSSESLQEAVARNSTWINSVITNSKLSSQLTELLSITSLDQKVIIQEGTLDAKYANPKTLRGYKGDWEADTNNPVLSNSSGVVGDIYKVSIGGNIDIGSGSVDYVVGDLIYLSEDNWIKISPNQISDIAGLQLALDSLAGALIPQGNWNANINDPDIATGASTGQFWIVSLAGSTDVGGITDWELNDWAVKTETGWAKIDNSDKVISVAGRVGVVTLGITDISGLTTSLAEAVKLTGDQTVAGIKSFTSDFKVADKVISTGDVLSLQTGNGFGGSLILNDAADTLVSNFDLLQVKSFLTSTGMSNNFNNSVLRVLAPNPINNTGLSSLSLATSDASSYGVSLNAWRFGTSGQPKFVLKMHNNSATGLDALIVDTSGNSVFAGTLAASNLIGTNTGDQSLSISGQVLTISGTNSITLPTQATGNFVTLDTTQTISGSKIFSSDLTISNTGSARLILNGDSNNSGDAGQEDAIIDFLGDAGDYGYRLNSENWSQKTAFNIQENRNGTYTSRLYIDNDGNVGIGTDDPSHELTVQGSASPNIELKNTNYSNGGFVLNRSNYGQQWKWWAQGSLMYFGYSTDEINYTNHLTIKSNGDLGIGTIDPQAKLEVQGSIYATPIIYSSSQDAYALRMGANNNTGFDMGIKIKSTSGGSPYMSFKVPSFEDLLVLKSGNVGIGTDNPQSKLQVTSGSTAETTLIVGASETSTNISSRIFLNEGETGVTNSKKYGFSLAYDGSGSAYGSLPANTFGIIRHNGTDAGVSVLSIGRGSDNVGIGTTTPDYRLDVISGTNNGIRVSATDTTSNWRDISIRSYTSQSEAASFVDGCHIYTTNPTSGTGAFTKYGGLVIQGRDDGNSGIYLRVGAGSGQLDVLTVNNSGRIGIMDTTPSYPLDVNGTIRATGNIIAYSDIRVKENVKTIDSALDKVTKLRGVEYNKIGEDSKSIGVIAQEIEKVVPEVVETDEKGMKAVAYGNISGLLIEAIKELKLEIEELKNNKCKCNI